MELPNHWEEQETQRRYLKSGLKSKKLKGYYIVKELEQNPGKPISCTQLYNLYQKSKHKHIDDNPDLIYIPQIDHLLMLPPELPIQITDEKTLFEIRKAVQVIMSNLQQARENNDLARVEELLDELEKYDNYISESTTRKGRIKCFPDQSRLNASSLYRVVQYYLKQLRAVDPARADYLEEHIVIGKVCYWSVDPLH